MPIASRKLLAVVLTALSTWVPGVSAQEPNAAAPVVAAEDPDAPFLLEPQTPEEFFSAIVETEGPYAAVAAMLAGEADVAVAWSSLTGAATLGYDFGVLTEMVRDGALAMDRIRLIWRSPLIPFGPHVVRTDLPPQIRRQIDGALAAMATDSPAALDAVDRSSVGGGGFVTVATGDYATVADLVGSFPVPGEVETTGSD